MKDAEARRRIRHDYSTTLWVEAAAGTGKTSELVGRIVGLVATGHARLATIAAVTFTEKAAGELKLRLRAEIERARTDPARLPDHRRRLDAAVGELETARIGTIHALCADLLRERPIEAALDPLFEVAAEDEQIRLFDAAFDPWFQTQLLAPPEGVRRLLRRPPDAEGRGPRLQLRQAGLLLADRRDFDGAWTRPEFDRASTIDDALEAIGTWGSYAARAHDPEHVLAQASAVAARFVDDTRRRERVRGRDHDGLEVALHEALREWDWDRTGRRGDYSPGLTRDDVVEARAQARRAMERAVELCDADLAACLERDLRSLVAAYETTKATVGRLDYVDLLLRVRDLLVRDATVRRDLQARFSHVCVDEFQDTDPLQADILLLLCADDPECPDPAGIRVAAGKLFVVGDPKQSIYRFRRADVGCYEAVKERLLASGAELVHLATSFRSDPRIQDAVNAAFAPRMQGEGQASYVPLEHHRPALPGQPALVALPVPHPNGPSGRPTVAKIDASLPEAVANFVEWLLCSSGWRVTEADRDAPVAIESRHVCLLFRQTQRHWTDLMGLFTRPLEARGIPHVLVGGRGFHERDEVLALRNALQAIEWPDDTFSVYATLKGPLFALPDDVLFLWRERVGSLSPLHRPAVEEDDPARDDLRAVAAALEVIALARRGRNRRPIASTLSALLAATRAHAGFASASSGEQVLANVLRVAQLARRFEAVAPTSFRAFVDWLDDEAERGESPDAPVVEEGTDGVRLMTVHKAKGLEFPVVVLADLTSTHARREPSRFIDAARRVWALPLAGCVPLDLRQSEAAVHAEDRREADRLAYVAATRARDLLVVPAIADAPRAGSWIEPLYPSLYPRAGTGQQPAQAEGCPPVNPAGDGGDGAAPGEHVPLAGDHRVVWWEPLGRTVQWLGGLRRHTLLESVVGEPGDGAARYQRWRDARVEHVRLATRPTFDVVLATEVRGRGGRVTIEETSAVGAGRPIGVRFGSLVHAALAAVPFDADALRVASIVALQSRVFGATREEHAAAIVAVEAALGHAVLQRAAASTDCRREVPVTWKDGDRIVEGIADLAFLEVSGWTVVDYKTDEDLAGRHRVYEAQLAAYVEAVRAATGAPALGVLLWV